MQDRFLVVFSGPIAYDGPGRAQGTPDRVIQTRFGYRASSLGWILFYRAGFRGCEIDRLVPPFRIKREERSHDSGRSGVELSE